MITSSVVFDPTEERKCYIATATVAQLWDSFDSKTFMARFDKMRD